MHVVNMYPLRLQRMLTSLRLDVFGLVDFCVALATRKEVALFLARSGLLGMGLAWVCLRCAWP